MTRKEQIFEESKIYSEYIYNQTDFENGFITGAKWADKNPNLQNIAEYLYKEKGYPISLNGEIPTFEETMKDVQTYNAYKAKQNSSELVNKYFANVWHNTSEKPELNQYFLAQIGDSAFDTFIMYMDENKDWRKWCEGMNIKMWAHINDLLPRGGLK